jgi:hypothetical protein
VVLKQKDAAHGAKVVLDEELQEMTPSAKTTLLQEKDNDVSKLTKKETHNYVFVPELT